MVHGPVRQAQYNQAQREWIKLIAQSKRRKYRGKDRET
jgi:hypothetical protein